MNNYETDSITPYLSRIAVHPIKSLEPVVCDRARIVANGGLEHDREYAMLDDEGRYVNGKRTADVHRIRSSFDDAIDALGETWSDKLNHRAETGEQLYSTARVIGPNEDSSSGEREETDSS